MCSSERGPQGPVAARRPSRHAGVRRRTRLLGSVVVLLMVTAVGVGVGRVDADPEEGTPASVRAPSSADVGLGLAKLATLGPLQLRKVAAPPVAKPPAVASTAVVLEGALHPRVRAAYENAQRIASSRWPRCRMRWTILAAIGTIESSNGRHQDGAVVLEDTGRIEPAILGPVLNGKGGHGLITDSDDGELDGDATFDRAVGPMQMIPSSWARHAQDANEDGVADPQSIDDAAAAAASYLCTAAGGSLRDPEALRRAIFSYNHSEDYVLAVWTQLERLDRSNGFGTLPPLATEPPPPEDAPAPERTATTDPPITTGPATTVPPDTTTTAPTQPPASSSAPPNEPGSSAG